MEKELAIDQRYEKIGTTLKVTSVIISLIVSIILGFWMYESPATSEDYRVMWEYMTELKNSPNINIWEMKPNSETYSKENGEVVIKIVSETNPNASLVVTYNAGRNVIGSKENDSRVPVGVVVVLSVIVFIALACCWVLGVSWEYTENEKMIRKFIRKKMEKEKKEIQVVQDTTGDTE